MKKLLLTFIILCVAVLHAADKGIRAKVELVSGAVQYAQFLGMQQDTVSLGGNIQGQFTVVKITRDRFKSIVDEHGNDLLNPATPPAVDSAKVAVQDSSQADPSADSAVAATQEVSTPTFLDSVEGKHIFVTLERRTIDSVLEAQITPLLARLLQESGTPVTIAPRTSFGYCRESSCTRDSLAKYGAASVFQGSISASASQDSLILQMTHTELVCDTTNPEEPKNVSDKIVSARISLSVFNSFSDALAENKLSNLAKQLQGDSIQPPTATPKADPIKDGPSYVKMETDPDGATITLPGKDDICKTPCTFAIDDTSKVDVYAYWNVGSQLWGVKKTFKPIPHDTTKISARLKKVKPEFRIFTIPEGAYIYAGSAPLSPSTEPIGKSPSKYDIYEPGTSFIQIRKEGFRDTLVSFYASPTEVTDVSVTLHPITNPAELVQQDEWVKARKKDFIGKVLMGSSIAPIIAGAIVTFLATRDYDDAKTIKDQLEKPAASGGAHYQAKVQENHDLVEKGDRKMIVGGSLLGAGALMLGVGFLLTF